MQPAIADSTAMVSQFAQLLAKRGVMIPRGTVAQALAITFNNAARPPLVQPIAVLKMRQSLPVRAGRQNFSVRRSFKAV